MDKIFIYADGGCKGNGTGHPEAYGSFAVKYKGDIKRRRECKFPEASTNNEAEYGALLAAFTYISELRDSGKPLPDIEILMDSELVVSQLTNGWKVKAANLKSLHQAARAWMDSNPTVELHHVPREQIEAVLGH